MDFEEWKKKQGIDIIIDHHDLKACWNAALDEAVKVTYNKGTEVNYHGIAEAIKGLKE